MPGVTPINGYASFVAQARDGWFTRRVEKAKPLLSFIGDRGAPLLRMMWQSRWHL